MGSGPLYKYLFAFCFYFYSIPTVLQSWLYSLTELVAQLETHSKVISYTAQTFMFIEKKCKGCFDQVCYYNLYCKKNTPKTDFILESDKSLSNQHTTLSKPLKPFLEAIFKNTK